MQRYVTLLVATLTLPTPIRAQAPTPFALRASAGVEATLEAPASIDSTAPCFDDAAACSRRWSCRVIPYGWLPQVQGELTVRGVTADVDADLGRVAEIMWNNINFAAMGQIEASNGRFGFIFNGVYSDESPGKRVGNLDFSNELRTAILDFAGTWELPGVAEAVRLPEGSRLEVLAGVRYNLVSSGLTVTGPGGNTATASGTEDWLDPIIGARLRVPLRRCLTAQVRGDVGGFDFGDASRFTWNIEATVEYRLRPHCSLLAGYRWLDINYERDRDNRRFGFDMNLNGPIVGIALDF